MSARRWIASGLLASLVLVACQRAQTRPTLIRAQPAAARVRPLEASPAATAEPPTSPDAPSIGALMEERTNPAMTQLAQLLRDQGPSDSVAAAADALVDSARTLEGLGDADFADFARELRLQAAEVSDAAQARDRRRMEHGFWHVRVSCMRCHDRYRPSEGPTEGAPLPDLPARTGPGQVTGQLTLDVPGVRLVDLAPLVAYLEPLERTASALPTPTLVPRISQRGARFEPNFLVVSAGQTVAWPNDDRIDHNVYSFSAPNAFDLGLYPQGEERRITLAEPGVLRVHCSIHRSMNALVLVAPTPLWAVVEADGAFRIPQVPPGRYTLTIWSDVLPVRQQELQVHPEASTSVRVPLGG